MIPQNKNQPGPPGIITLWGHPWHGLVEDGVLTLPNAATMAYPAPSGAGEADVLVFRVPGTPAVTRTPEQTAADAAAGRQWLDHAIISGRSTRRLYGQAIGGNGSWLYAAPDGSRWLVTLADVPGTHDLTTAWTATLTCARFGEFGHAPESHDLTATLADWQQDIPGHSGGDYVLNGDNITTGVVVLEDVRADGSAAVLMISVNLNDKLFGLINPLRRRSLGFVECTLTGTPGVDGAASLDVVRSRADTLGTVSLSSASSMVVWYHDQNVGTWDGDYSDESDDMQAFVGSASESNSLSDRILAMVYADGVNLAEITLSTSYEWTQDAPMPPDGITSLTRTSSSSSSGLVTLSGPGGSVEITLAQGMTSTSVYDHSDPANAPPSILETNDESATIGADTITGSTSSVQVFDPPDILRMGHATTTDFGLSLGEDGYNIDFRILHAYLSGPSEVTTRVLCVTRYSATALDLTLGIHVSHGGGIEAYEEFRYLGAVGRGSGAGEISETTPRPFGSAHPVTGEIARARDVPVCWV